MAKFYVCKICGNLVEKIEDGGTTPSCCNQTMTELRSASTDGATEAHVPVIQVEKYCYDVCKVHVAIGATPHPMTDTHHIRWIEICTTNGVYRKRIGVHDAPEADFFICRSETVVAAYAYCNLHGLWEGGR